MKKISSILFARGFVSMWLTFLFAGLIVSGIVLYFAPSGSVAKSMQWKFLFLNKEQWSSMHQLTALVIVILSILHLFVYNWKTFKCYLKRRKTKVARLEVAYSNENEKKSPGFWVTMVQHFSSRRELYLALIFSMVIYTGSITMVGPFAWLHEGGEKIREAYRQEVPDRGGRGRGASRPEATDAQTTGMEATERMEVQTTGMEATGTETFEVSTAEMKTRDTGSADEETSINEMDTADSESPALPLQRSERYNQSRDLEEGRAQGRGEGRGRGPGRQ